MRFVALFISIVVASVGAASAQAPITPEQAADAVRQFCGEPGLTVTVQGPYDDGPVSYDGWHYDASVATGTWCGSCVVRATDGMVLSMALDYPTPAEPLGLTMAECRAIAQDFARAHYPGLDQQQWLPIPDRYVAGYGGFFFLWQRVLNA
ncbi:MAG: hypothetical protein HY321_13130 [Armatimonadetes bacterium]|nr:hypothetical protein [Armatimonadota bacterium]